MMTRSPRNIFHISSTSLSLRELKGMASVDKNFTASYYNPKSTINLVTLLTLDLGNVQYREDQRKQDAKENEPLGEGGVSKEFKKTTYSRAKDDLETTINSNPSQSKSSNPIRLGIKADNSQDLQQN
ncbi:hypothetical protein RF11_11536 [Thelohanellus kitauei]|uniref:Uncharacterized protein n=1 Tax=Thelohanellus kitauei TaxID=669202 RepID=A0A0C2J0I6_THEKT|nr:hypothetical protein RF11_11536 [Thelohanellus kitauei]